MIVMLPLRGRGKAPSRLEAAPTSIPVIASVANEVSETRQSHEKDEILNRVQDDEKQIATVT